TTHTVSITRMLSSRATIAAATSPPRVMQTIASNGPASASRQASARASRWNWSHETGNAFSACTCTKTPCPVSPFMLSRGLPQGRLDPREHRFDRGFGGGERRRVAGAHDNVGVRPARLVEERIAADTGARVRLGDLAEL